MAYLAEQVKGQTSDFKRGFKLGVMSFAWWKDGVQYLGTCGTTLVEAMEEIQAQEVKDKEESNSGGVPNPQTILERAAKKAATTGNRADLQEYLKLRRNFI